MTETIGSQLKQAREKRNLTIENIVQATHILSRHIEAIEADDFEALSSPVQARAFLRLYAEYLGLSLDELISRQREEFGQLETNILEKPNTPAQPETDSPEKINEPELVSASSQNFFLTLKEKTKLNFNKLKFTFLSWVQGIKEKVIKPTEVTSGLNTGEVIVKEKTQPEPSGWVDEHFPEEENKEIKNEQKESQAIFISIGESLISRRESLSLTLDEIERHTHVRQRYLTALEKGDFDDLPSSVQGRGMLNNYAHFLDMDLDAILLQYAEGLQARRLENQPKPETEEKNTPKRFLPKFTLPPKIRRYFTMDMMVGTGLVIILLILAIWGTTSVIKLGSGSTPVATAPSISDILQTQQGSTPNISISTSASSTNENNSLFETTFSVTNQAQINGAVQVTAFIIENAWMRVTVDGKVSFNGRVTPGSVYPFGGNNQIEVLTGSGSAIRILYNQSDLGLMGSLGQVVDRIYTSTSILNPTPTNTPTVTISPIPSKTVKASSTPTPSKTPAYTPTQ
jgi:cytoskeleton protein RodZ